MSKSLKVALVGLVVLVVLVLGGHYVSGLTFKSKYLAGVEWANQEFRKNPSTRDLKVNIQVENYEAGIFGATAQMKINFVAGSGTPVTLVFKEEIRHGLAAGFALGSVRSELEVPQEVAAGLRAVFGEDPLAGKSPLVIDAVIGWTGNASGRLESPRFTGKAGETEIKWEGISGEYTSTGSVRSGSFSGVWSLDAPGLSVQDGYRHVEVGHLRGKGDSARANGRSFYTGLSEASVDKFIYKEAEKNLAVENLKISTDVRETDGAVDLVAKYEIGKILANDTTIDAASLTVAFEKLDADALDALFASFESALPGEDSFETFSRVALQHRAAILRRKPVLAIRDSSVKLGAGSILLNARLSYAGENPEQFNPQTDLVLDADLGVTRALLVQEFSKKVREELTEEQGGTEEGAALEQLVASGVEQKIAELTETGYVADKDGKLTIALHMQGETVTLNGKPVEGNPLSALGSLPF
ncbi:MAG: YdgA family protein [Zoogloeaceae bacterium]|jgi:uncharacterized protein YdgA (DUF945 family)|nr:YdgA family protein [Zoogloeaceae bacterium]